MPIPPIMTEMLYYKQALSSRPVTRFVSNLVSYWVGAQMRAHKQALPD
jgi:hypothetical protein